MMIQQIRAAQGALGFAILFAGTALTGAAFAWSIAHEAGTVHDDLSRRGAFLATSRYHAFSSA